jgi:hypothetical protein
MSRIVTLCIKLDHVFSKFVFLMVLSIPYTILVTPLDIRRRSFGMMSREKVFFTVFTVSY